MYIKKRIPARGANCNLNSIAPCLSCSFYEESNADKAIQALTAALAPRAKVLRDCQVRQIDAADLVPGDVIVIRIGKHAMPFSRSNCDELLGPPDGGIISHVMA
jgi:hypothetical protein